MRDIFLTKARLCGKIGAASEQSIYPILRIYGVYTMTLLVSTVSFIFIALAAKRIGAFFSQQGLPYITGYLLAGIVAGPFVLNLLPEGTTTTLRYIDEVSLAVIAFVAGSELYLKDLQKRLKSILAINFSVLVFGLALGTLALFVLTAFIPFADDMGVPGRIAVALLGATVLLALSPASTIAVIQEVRARGSYTSTILGVTVAMDVVIIVFFAVAVAVASALLTGMGFSGSFLLLLLVDLGAAALAGAGVGLALAAILGLTLDKRIKAGAILILGMGLFAGAYWLVDFSYVNLPFEIHVEALLVAMIGGFYVTNFTPYRDLFDEILHDVSPAIYVAFFTLTGVGVKLDILMATWPIALALFATRIGSIFLGSYVGGTLAGESTRFRRLAWMGLITQAGIALGLAREVAVEFPALGESFATLIISVVVLNEIFGPMFLKAALRRAGETNLPDVADRDEVRDVLILGVEEQSLALARQLQGHDWQVIMADTDRGHVERLAAEDVDERYIPEISHGSLSDLITSATDAVVAMLDDDQANLTACRLAYEKFGITRLVVRLRDLSLADEFMGMGAVMVDPASAMVSLIDQGVRAPHGAALLMHTDPEREIVQVTVSNPEVDGAYIRDLRLPSDVLFLDIFRNGHSVVPNGYSHLHMRDEVTLLGKPKSLQEVTLRLGY